MNNRQEALISFEAQGTLLEGRMTRSVSDRAVVITHPHPQYGGDMDNPVVDMIARAYQSCGWTTLCFNFRGVGGSQGVFDHGEGEQKDIDAAIACLARADATKIDLAGYSFGAWIISRWAQANIEHRHTIRLIAPPVAFMDYHQIERIDGLTQVVVGGRDDIAPAALVEKLMQIWQPRSEFNIIENADHFFQGHMQELQTVLTNAIPTVRAT